MEITPKNNTSQHVQPAELGQEEKLGADENLCHATVGNFRCFWHPDDGKVMGSWAFVTISGLDFIRFNFYLSAIFRGLLSANPPAERVFLR